MVAKLKIQLIKSTYKNQGVPPYSWYKLGKNKIDTINKRTITPTTLKQ